MHRLACRPIHCALDSSALHSLHSLHDPHAIGRPAALLALGGAHCHTTCLLLLPTGRTAKVVTAAELAAADIVLTTYDVLRRDINHAPDGQGAGHNLRRRKKYEVMLIGGLA